jgi:uncharacterized membrane protein YebE (DUF533 family)
MDVGKLFGKLLHEIIGSGGSQFKKKHKKYKKKYKHKGGDGYYRQSESSHHVSKKSSLLDNLTGNLKSGKGLLTAIGLGVGAYEIYRTSKQAPQQQASPTQLASAPPPPPPSPTGMQQEQVMNSASRSVSPVPTSPAETVSAEPLRTVLDEQEVARRLIQVMVGAAHADGMLDSEEEKVILDRLRDAELAQEEKMFLLEELHHPRTVPELTQGIEDVRLGQAMYAVAASAVVIDTESERTWFDELGRSLGLSPEVCLFIEENQ